VVATTSRGKYLLKKVESIMAEGVKLPRDILSSKVG